MFLCEEQCIPKCELMMEWTKKVEAPTRLQLEIILNGARRPKSLQLVLDPEKGSVTLRTVLFRSALWQLLWQSLSLPNLNQKADLSVAQLYLFY